MPEAKPRAVIQYIDSWSRDRKRSLPTPARCNVPARYERVTPRCCPFQRHTAQSGAATNVVALENWRGIRSVKPATESANEETSRPSENFMMAVVLVRSSWQARQEDFEGKPNLQHWACRALLLDGSRRAKWFEAAKRTGAPAGYALAYLRALNCCFLGTGSETADW